MPASDTGQWPRSDATDAMLKGLADQGHTGDDGARPNKPKQATSGTQEQPRFESNRPCRSRLMGKDVGRAGSLEYATAGTRQDASDADE